MLIPFATLLAYSIALPSAITEPPRDHPPAVRRKVDPERARAERTQTLEARREFRHRQHQLAVERAAKDAVDNAPPPPQPVLGSTGMTTNIVIPVHVIAGGGMPMGGMGGNPMQQVGIPPTAGQLPIGYLVTYAPMIRRMFTDAGL